LVKGRILQFILVHAVYTSTVCVIQLLSYRHHSGPPIPPDRVQKVDCSVVRELNFVIFQGGREVTYSLWQYRRAGHG